MKRFEMLRNEAGGEGGGGGDASGGQSTLLAGAPDTGAGGGNSSAPAQKPAAEAQPAGSQGSGFNFTSLIGPDGRFVQGYAEKLPEGLKEHAAHFSKYADPLQALQHTLNLQQLLGKKADAVVIPAADAPKEEWLPVLKRLGVPDVPEGYNLKVPDKLPDGVTVDEAELKEFAQVAHGLGLTPQQVAKLQEYDLARAGKQAGGFKENLQAIEKAEFQKQKDALTKAWGTGQEATKKHAMAERAALTFGYTPEEIKTDPLFRNARFVQTLALAGEKMGEDSLVSGDNLNSQSGLMAKAQDIISNPQNPLYKKYWDGDEAVNSQVRGWMKSAG